ncbi:hypothetical protein [Lacrimispora sp.]|uniref:hypothetical protein n=1 Tax=Lacrimispora sp. TaxID=2719234 RepID=UPI0034611162
MKQNGFLGSLNKSNGMTDEEYFCQQAGLLLKVSRTIGIERVPDVIHAMMVVCKACELRKSQTKTMKQALKEAIGEMGGIGGGTVQADLYIDRVKFGHMVHKYNKNEVERVGVKFVEPKEVDHFAECVKEIVQAFENHYIAVGDVEMVLDRVKTKILSSTPVHAKPKF